MVFSGCSTVRRRKIMSAVKDENPMVSTFEADDQRFICLNGGPEYRPNPSISFYVIYESEKDDEEIRY